MKYCEASPGRIFVLRLEDGEIIHEVIETFAKEKSICAASLIAVGGGDTRSTLVTGPKDGRAEKIEPIHTILDGTHELMGTGTIFLNESGAPKLHMHMACGREGGTVTGCIIEGVRTWHILEVIIFELSAPSARRCFDPVTGFELLDPTGANRDKKE
jgi:predicted DNA-binding protein with PD1-like motif